MEEAKVVSNTGVNTMGVLEDIAARLAAVEAKLANGAAAAAAVVPAAAAQPVVTGYDPATGQPIYGQPAAAAAAVVPAVAAQPVITGYDPATGQPIYGQPAAAAVVPAAGAVTEAQVMALIEPHLENVPLKTALQGVLAQMGIARLPDARPDQYGALYTAFSAVIAAHTGAAGAVVAQPAVGII